MAIGYHPKTPSIKTAQGVSFLIAKAISKNVDRDWLTIMKKYLQLR
jgi:hypothetical protein